MYSTIVLQISSKNTVTFNVRCLAFSEADKITCYFKNSGSKLETHGFYSDDFTALKGCKILRSCLPVVCAWPPFHIAAAGCFSLLPGSQVTGRWVQQGGHVRDHGSQHKCGARCGQEACFLKQWFKLSHLTNMFAYGLITGSRNM